MRQKQAKVFYGGGRRRRRSGVPGYDDIIR
jgi:hypothetical protein